MEMGSLMLRFYHLAVWQYIATLPDDEISTSNYPFP